MLIRMIALTFNINTETSLMIILIVLFFSNFTILQAAYSQEDTSLPTNPTGQSQATTNDGEIGPFIIFLIIVLIIYSIYESLQKDMVNTEKDDIFLLQQKNIQYENSIINVLYAKGTSVYGILTIRMETGLTIALVIVKLYVLIVMQRKHEDY
jgi:hypothetical protein